MLQINELHLKRFCQFDSFDMELGKGLTRIAGPNGSGKTTIFRAFVYGLTGWCDPSWGTQSELQKDDEVLPGYVSLNITINGEQYTLTRYTLVTPKTPDRITKDSKLVVEKRQRVNAWLEQYLDVPLTVLAQLIWLRQEQASWLLTATASSINTFLGIIFDTKKLEKLRDGIKKSIDNIASLRESSDTVIAAAKATLSELEDEVELQTKLKEVGDAVTEKAKEMTIADKGITEKEKNDRYLKLTEEISSAQAFLDLEALEKPSTEEPSETVLKNTQEAIEAYSESVTRDTQSVKHLQTKLDILTQGIADIENAEACTCVYCGAVINDKESYMITLYAALMRGISEPINTKGYTFSEVQKIVYQQKEKLNKEIMELKSSISQNEEALNQHRNTMEYLKHIQRDWSAYREDLHKQIQAKAVIEQCKLQLENLESLPVITKSAKAISSEYDELKKQMDLLQHRLIEVKTERSKAEYTIKVAEETQKLCSINKKARLLLTTLRECLSQSRAQARYINSKVDLLNNYINNFLLMSEMPFVLELDKTEHIFRYHMTDSDVWHPAGMLSGAQKAAASIAIQMALLRVAVSDVTLLLIDEADASLDMSNKFIAARLYKDVSQSFSSVEGSVLIISQAEEITRICDKEVDVCLR